MNLGQFARRMAAISSGIPENVAELMGKVALSVDQAVVLGTPVDTGRARSNWIVSRGAPDSRTRSPYSPGNKLGLGETGNLSGALDQAKGEVNAFKLSDGSIWISNNLKYIGKLDAGGSRQAPAGITAIGVAAGVAAVPQARIIR